tara:strand:- start:295 stop:681 length:387 start_codon:yes stop_codon:yes gene_type:complete
MSTRAQVRFATREEGVSFSEHPDVIHAQFYVHHDGYPEGLGVEIAESLTSYKKIMRWEIEELCAKHGDLEYIYYVWQSKYKSTWISIFEVNGYWCEHCDKYIQKDKCIFVGEPSNLIDKYKPNTNANG